MYQVKRVLSGLLVTPRQPLSESAQKGKVLVPKDSQGASYKVTPRALMTMENKWHTGKFLLSGASEKELTAAPN